MNFLGELPRPLTRLVEPENPDKQILLKNQRYKNIVDIWPISSGTRKLLILLDTRAGSSILRENQLTRFLKTQVVHESRTPKTYDANQKPLRVIDSSKLYAHVDGILELVSFLVCERLDVLAILGRKFCDLFVKRMYRKTCLVKLVDKSVVVIFRHYGKQRSAGNNNKKTLGFPKQKGLASP